MLIHLNKYLQSLPGHTLPRTWKVEERVVQMISNKSLALLEFIIQQDRWTIVIACCFFFLSWIIKTVGMSLKQTLTFVTQRIPDKWRGKQKPSLRWRKKEEETKKQNQGTWHFLRIDEVLLESCHQRPGLLVSQWRPDSQAGSLPLPSYPDSLPLLPCLHDSVPGALA